jgi:hypothetical protein
MSCKPSNGRVNDKLRKGRFSKKVGIAYSRFYPDTFFLERMSKTEHSNGNLERYSYYSLLDDSLSSAV